MGNASFQMTSGYLRGADQPPLRVMEIQDRWTEQGAASRRIGRLLGWPAMLVSTLKSSPSETGRERRHGSVKLLL